MNPIYVGDNRGTNAGWTLTSYMVAPAAVAGTACDGSTVAFCNTTPGTQAGLGTAPDNYVTSGNLSISAVTSAAIDGNLNTPPAGQPGGAYGGAPITLSQATVGNSGGTFSVSGGSYSLTIPASTTAGLYDGTVEFLVS